MAENVTKPFEVFFGIPFPREIAEFLDDREFRNLVPLTLKFSHQTPILEIECLLDIQDPTNYYPDKKLVAFALNGDGFELLIDLESKDFQIMQEEYGDIDYIGFCIKNLQGAERIPVG